MDEKNRNGVDSKSPRRVKQVLITNKNRPVMVMSKLPDKSVTSGVDNKSQTFVVQNEKNALPAQSSEFEVTTMQSGHQFHYNRGTNASPMSPVSEVRTTNHVSLGTYRPVPLNRTIMHSPAQQLESAVAKRRNTIKNTTVTDSKAWDRKMKELTRRNSLNYLTASNWRQAVTRNGEVTFMPSDPRVRLL